MTIDDDVSIDELREAVEHLHGVPASYIESVEVNERFQGKPLRRWWPTVMASVRADLVRALHIDARFQSLQLGLVDSLVCAVAERRDAMRVLTTDVRDFSVVRVGARYDRGLTLVP